MFTSFGIPYKVNFESMYKALYLSPMIPSFNIRETMRFFMEVLDFKVAIDNAVYVVLYKDKLTLHILQAGTNIGQMEFYMEVDNLDQLWDGIKEKVKELKVREPFDRDYGMREVHIEIPYTKTLLFIGQEIEKK